MADIAKIVDYCLYPIADTYSTVLQGVLARARHELSETGIALLPNFMLPSAITETIDDTEQALPNAFHGISDHNVYLTDCEEKVNKDPEHPGKIVSRSSKTCVTHNQIKASTPLNKLYMSPEMTDFVRLLLQKEVLYRTADPLGALNVHVYKENDQLNWHFDRGEFAVTILLQSPEDGGHFQYIPSTRSEENENYGLVKSVLLASQAGQDVTNLGVKEVDLQPGTLVVFCGRNSLHRVTPVKGGKARILSVLSYEQRPDVHLNEYTRMKFYGRLR